jgi:hypothetical protein
MERLAWTLLLCVSVPAAAGLSGCSQGDGGYRTYTEPDATTATANESTAEAVPVKGEAGGDPIASSDASTATGKVESVKTATAGQASETPSTPAPETSSTGEATTVTPTDAAASGTPSPEGSRLLAAAGTSDVAPVAGPREVKLLVPERTFRPEGPEGAVRVSYDDVDLLKVLNMEPVTTSAPDLLPPWLKGLEGQRIRLRGFMYPPPIETGIPYFILARDNQICCFGKDPKAYDIIPVQMRSGMTTDYISGRPFDVVGVFHVQLEMNIDDETKVGTLYFIDDAVVIDK